MFACRHNAVEPCPAPGMPAWAVCTVDVAWYMNCLKSENEDFFRFGRRVCDERALSCAIEHIYNCKEEGNVIAVVCLYTIMTTFWIVVVAPWSVLLLSIVGSLVLHRCLWTLPLDHDAIDEIEDREKSFYDDLPRMSGVHICTKVAMDYFHLIACTVHGVQFARIGLMGIAISYWLLLVLAVARKTYHGNRPLEEFCIARRGLELGLVTNAHIGIYRDTRDVLSLPSLVLSVYGFPYMVSSPIYCMFLEITIAAKYVGMVNYVWYSIDLNALRPKPVRNVRDAIAMTVQYVGTVGGIELMKW
jgi:hypothetical protein